MKKLSDKYFSENLGLIINTLGISQREVAERCGITQACLSQIINGKRDPSLKTIIKILNLIPIKFENLCCKESINEK